jgi:hypothetical protein
LLRPVHFAAINGIPPQQNLKQQSRTACEIIKRCGFVKRLFVCDFELWCHDFRNKAS